MLVAFIRMATVERGRSDKILHILEVQHRGFVDEQKVKGKGESEKRKSVIRKKESGEKNVSSILHVLSLKYLEDMKWRCLKNCLILHVQRNGRRSCLTY